MAELAPKSDRTKGVYGRVHAAQARLPALIFISPDFSTDDKHPENYLQYYPHAEIIKLPSGTEAARATILDRIYMAKERGEHFHAMTLLSHGGPGEMAIGGQNVDIRGINVEKLLNDIVEIQGGTEAGNPIASNIILNSCDVLANATSDYLDRLVQVHQKLGANLIASANTAFANTQRGKNHWFHNEPTPASGRFYQIAKNGHFVPYFDFRNEEDLKLGDTSTEKIGLNSTLVEKRATLDANCSTNPAALCSSLKMEYAEFAAYADIKNQIDEHGTSYSRPEESVERVKTLTAIAPKLPVSERIQVLGHIAALTPFEADGHRQALEQSLDIVMSGSLKGDMAQIKKSMKLLTNIDTMSSYNSVGNPTFALTVAQKLVGIKGMPSDDQLKVWQVTQDKLWKEDSRKRSAWELIPYESEKLQQLQQKFESSLVTKLDDQKYDLADRLKLAKTIMTSDSDNTQLKDAAKKLDCKSSVICSTVGSIKHLLVGDPDTQKKQSAPDDQKKTVPDRTPKTVVPMAP